MGLQLTATKNTEKRRDPQFLKNQLRKKEAAITQALRTDTGIKRLAAALANPVRKYLDYVGIIRKIFVYETIADGNIPFFDNDIEEWSGVKIGADGASEYIICKALRTILEPYEIDSHPKIPYKELRVRKYKVFDRAKQRLQQSIAIKEDLLGFSLLHTSATLTNTEYIVAGPLTPPDLALAFREVERHRLLGAAVICNPDAISCVRRWNWTHIDEVARIEIRQRGYVGNLWGANFFVTNLITPDSDNNSYLYVTAPPQFLAWMPVLADSEIVPADQPDNLLLGFVGYDLLSMVVHNSRAVARVRFSLT